MMASGRFLSIAAKALANCSLLLILIGLIAVPVASPPSWICSRKGAAAMEKAVAEHIAAHPEDAGRTVKDFRWVVWEIVRKPQELPQELFEDELTAKDTDEDAAVSQRDAHG